VPRSPVSLYRRIERALETMTSAGSPLETLHRTAVYLVESFADDLGISGGRIYTQDDGSYELVSTFGEVSKAPVGLRVWRTYPPFEELLAVGSLVMARDDPRLDQRLEEDLGTRDWFAAIAVAHGRFVLSFDVADGGHHDELVATLNIVRLVLNQKVREEQVLGVLEEAHQIQLSILPHHLPSTSEFQIAARSLPAEVVGGDFYDVIMLDDELFTVVVADATGHGLPAALQVRDMFTGLRMGLSREFKLTRTLERLNQIIHRTRLATKFVSAFVAEVHPNGTILYCNAGHPPALLVRGDGAIDELAKGGMLLGPTPAAAYEIGVAEILPGDLLVVYTDGITEARRDSDSDEEYGEARLIHTLRKVRHLDPVAVVDRTFTAVNDFSGAASPHDDQTVLVVKRRPAALEEAPA